MGKVKRCKECGKVLRSWNDSGLCRYHYQKTWKVEGEVETDLEEQEESEVDREGREKNAK